MLTHTIQQVTYYPFKHRSLFTLSFWLRISIFMLVILFICPVFFLSHKHPSQLSRLLLEPVFKFYIHTDSGDVCCVRENQDGEIFFLFAHLPCNCIYKIMVQHTSDTCGRGM